MEGRQRLSGAFLIELARIRPDPGQPRKNLDTQAQRELTDSIARIGILQPVTVRFLDAENTYQIIAGERRFQAATRLGLPAIPCWVQTPKAQDVLLHQIVENWQRADLQPFELADALVVLRDSNGYSQRQLADLTGKPESEISRLLSLLNLAPDIQKTAREDDSGSLTRRHLIAVAQLPREEQPQVVQRIQATHLSAIETEKVVREAKDQAHGSNRRGSPLTQRLRYLTSKAAVTLTFRRRNVTAEDILATLAEVRDQVLKGSEGQAER